MDNTGVLNTAFLESFFLQMIILVWQLCKAHLALGEWACPACTNRRQQVFVEKTKASFVLGLKQCMQSGVMNIFTTGLMFYSQYISLRDSCVHQRPQELPTNDQVQNWLSLATNQAGPV